MQMGSVELVNAKIQVPCPLVQVGLHLGWSHNGPVYSDLQMHPFGVWSLGLEGFLQYPPSVLHPFNVTHSVQLAPSQPGLHLHTPGAMQ